MNPIGDWFADGGMAWKQMTHLCYATSTDGINIRIVDKYWRLSLVPLASVRRPLLLTGW